MDASLELPFIMVSYKGSTYYKIYQAADSIIPPAVIVRGETRVPWIEFTPLVDGIYFKVSNIKGKNPGRALIQNVYSTGVWFFDNRIEVSFTTSFEGSEEVITQRIFRSLGDRLKYDVISTKQISIKGTFFVPSLNFDKVVFADMIATDDIFRYFVFANERDTSKQTGQGPYKTLTTRKNFYFYYSPNQSYNIPGSLALTITPDPLAKGCVIRIKRAVNIQQAIAVKNVLSKLFRWYLTKYDEIAEVYSIFESKAKPKREKERKKDKKTGPRASALEEFDPSLFRSRYPDQCQREKQPYILYTEDEAKKKAKELGDPHKVIPFGNVWYACEPRESDDKDDRHTWPGLKLNTSKTGNTEFDQQYKREVPLIPCCYTQDQYVKRASEWRKYLENEGKFIPETKEKDIGVGHIVKAANPAGNGRYGEVPFNWEKLLRYLKIEKITKGKQNVYPLLRRGVAMSPDSIVHCLESAMTEYYSQLRVDEQRKHVLDVRQKIAQSNISIGYQELYDMTEAEIRDALKDPEQYLAPEMYVSILQAYYKCNIFMYVVDTDHPNGEILLPRSAGTHLAKDVNEHLKTILIVKYEAKAEPLPSGQDYPYQCELMCMVDIKDRKFDKVTTYFEGDDIVQLATKLYYDSNDVFIVSPEGYDMYRPVPEGM